MGTGPAYPPFSDAKMVVPGVATQLVELVLQGLDYQVEMRRQPWNRLMREARNLELAAIYPYVVTPERAKDFLASDPLFHIKLRFFGLADDGRDWDLGSAEQPVRLCRPNGYALNEDLRPYLQHHEEIQWIRPNSLESCFLMLERGRVDLIPINLATGRYTIKRTFDTPPSIRTIELFEDDATLHLLVPKARPGAEALLERFNRELARVKLSPAGKRIYEQVDQFLSQEPLIPQ
ncbi:MAG: transporter substrate-binding domain-containing protein [Marinobacter sp.]|uniref:substrate-binding periplasmic protein n=1 Tax=Marinobacter sp. TaxID=50741 RepID=UPI00299DB17E|nr:transporter substrate-binding domain-containing protein [Marinobacter sp.]MDX1634083.1 transporter substrate-binding domain-containing protein [Marinobacter sp.]